MKRNFFHLLFLLLMPVLIGIDLSPVLASNKSQDIPQRPPLEVYYDIPEKYYRPSTEKKPAQPGEDNSIEHAAPNPYDALVFESYQYGSWDIFSAQPEGTYRVRLTTDAAMDIDPQCNHGCSWIVFASDRTGTFEIYKMRFDGSEVTRLTNNSTNDIRPSWSPDGNKIVFEAYRDGQAEIYTMNADGSNQVRLTNSGGFDGEPAWSPDGSKIAFISSRDGWYRVWKMNANGSSLTPLTSADKNCTHPVWFPDGSQIAYSLMIPGMTEYYRVAAMTADGVYINYHTYGCGALVCDQLAGSFSTDGKLLSYTEVYWKWSPEGMYWDRALMKFDEYPEENTTAGPQIISYNSTVDMEPRWKTRDAVPPESTFLPLPAQSPSPIKVSWYGLDNLSGIATYDVQVKEDAGSWVDWFTGTTTTRADYPGTGGHTYSFRVRAKDRSGNLESWNSDPDASTMVEALQPHASIEALPEHSRNYFLVHWSGEDEGGSGIKNYDIEYRQGVSGAWQPWLSATSLLYKYFFATPGEVYFFRVRAQDNAQNLEEWNSTIGDTQTTIYSWAIDGVVTDYFGVPLPEQELAISPYGSSPATTGDDGSYLARVSDDASAYTVSIENPEFGVLPQTNFSRDDDAHFDAVLPPLVNIIDDSGFESGSLTAGGWTASGDNPPEVQSLSRHTGTYGVNLNPQKAEFAPPIETPFYYSLLNGIKMDDQGTIHGVLVKANQDIYYFRRPRGGEWNQELVATYGTSTAMDMAEDRTLHVVWTGFGNGLYYRRRFSTGEWSDTLFLGITNGSSSRMVIRVQDDVAHIVYVSNQSEWKYVRIVNGTPSNAIIVPSCIPGSSIGDHYMEVDTSGRMHFIARCDQTYLSYIACSTNGCENPIILTNSSYYVINFDVALDETDRLHVVFSYYNNSPDIYHRYLELGGTWSNRLQAVDGTIMASNIHLASSGSTLHLVWSSSSRIYYKTYTPTGGWTEIEEVSDTAEYEGKMELAVSPDGTAHVIARRAEAHMFYYQKPSDGSWSPGKEITTALGDIMKVVPEDLRTIHVFYNGYYLGPATEKTDNDILLSRQISIPAEMPYPTLSFLYEMGNASETGGSGLSVTLEDESKTIVELYSSNTDTAEWQHVWYDLSPWIGQDVVLTFKIHQTAGFLPVWANLDEVTLGSYYPDLWVRITPDRLTLPPGVETIYTYTLSYANSGTALAKDLSLQVSLPAGMEYVSASTDPTSNDSGVLIWSALGDLDKKSETQTITLTLRVRSDVLMGSSLVLPANISSATSEFVTLNNTYQAFTYVGYGLYLPFLFGQ